MKGACWEGVRVVRGRLYQISWYPGLILDPDAPPVVGELWAVTPERLRQLDEFEGVPEGQAEGGEYRRIRATVEIPPDIENAPLWEGSTGSQAPREAWIWEWKGNPEEAQLVASGDWLDLETPPQKPVFTSIGCMGILGFTIGLQYMVGLIGSWFLSSPMPCQLEWGIHLFGLVVAFVLGGFCIKMAIRRREPGHPFQILIGLALIYLLYLLLVSVAALVFA